MVKPGLLLRNDSEATVVVATIAVNGVQTQVANPSQFDPYNSLTSGENETIFGARKRWATVPSIVGAVSPAFFCYLDLMSNAVLTPRLKTLQRDAALLLQQAVADYGDVVYSSSLGIEAMVLTDLIFNYAPEIEIFTLDTGRLPPETLELLDRVERRYKQRIKVYYPNAESVERYVQENGINGFYAGLAERQACCQVRKVEPFMRAIQGRKAWVTGVRKEQTSERAKGQPVEWDTRYSMWKVCPVLDWSEADIHDYVQALALPYSPLHDQGYPSIGCAPCTRAVEPGADPRSGRWWWENPETRECGLQPRTKVIPIKREKQAVGS